MSNYIKKNNYSKMKINDGHWHITRQYPIEETLEYVNKEMDYLNLDRMAALSYEYGNSGNEIDHSVNMKALYLRDKSEGRIYAFASLHYCLDARDNAEVFLRQVKRYHSMGFDGIKMLEGKPGYHNKFQYPLDGEMYAKVFAYLEENKIPLVVHVADFIPFPDDDKYAERESLHTQMLNVLERHPKLRVTFAHMFNMSYDRKRLDSILEKYENTSLDLALGGDFMINFSNEIDEWRKFFIKYSDRIIYGTDTYNMYFEEDDDYEITGRHTPLHEFFERDKPFSVDYYDRFPELYGGKVVLNPAKLPEDTVKDIYYNSFIKAFGEKPKTTNAALASEYCNELIEGYKNKTLSTETFVPMPDWISPTEKANMARGNALALENLEVIKKYYEEKLK